MQSRGSFSSVVSEMRERAMDMDLLSGSHGAEKGGKRRGEREREREMGLGQKIKRKERQTEERGRGRGRIEGGTFCFLLFAFLLFSMSRFFFLLALFLRRTRENISNPIPNLTKHTNTNTYREKE
mgnify:CR=1 FL=1